MKLARSKSKIVGLQTGKITVKLINGSVVLRVKFALLTEGGETSGYFQKSTSWSDKTEEALQKLAECLEADALAHIFEEEPEEEVSKTNEPDQI